MWRDPIPDPICMRCHRAATVVIDGKHYCTRVCAGRARKPQDDSATSEEKPA